MSTSITSIPHNLHPSNHLPNSEESQKLSHDNSPSSRLRRINVANSLKDASRVRSIDALGQELARVTDAFDNSLEILLESGDGTLLPFSLACLFNCKL
jgi:hypothetical protein